MLLRHIRLRRQQNQPQNKDHRANDHARKKARQHMPERSAADGLKPFLSCIHLRFDQPLLNITPGFLCADYTMPLFAQDAAQFTFVGAPLLTKNANAVSIFLQGDT
jgi:hypothetical protein